MDETLNGKTLNGYLIGPKLLTLSLPDLYSWLNSSPASFAVY
jgi:hypothetical protein